MIPNEIQVFKKKLVTKTKSPTMQIVTLLLIFSICALSSIKQTEAIHPRWRSRSLAEKECVYSSFRLPQSIKPQHYHLELDVNTDRFTYQGTVNITLELDETKLSDEQLAKEPPKNVVVLHSSKRISIDKVKFDCSSCAAPANVKEICRDEENELLVITLERELSDALGGSLRISFHAKLNRSPNLSRGFHNNSYRALSGEQKVLATTLLETDGARRVFPCFDEPNFEATFDVTLVHDSKLVALSNGAILSSIQMEGGGTETTYKTTPRMAPYMLAIVIGELEYIERVVSDGRLRLRAYTVLGKKDQAVFALETAARAIKLMEEYFEVPFVMDKIDMVAVPAYADDAMENWGLIIIRQQVFLYDENNTSSGTKAAIATTMIHELAHQWFGNLVPLKWWTDIWLNEGFATWMQHHFTHKLFPEFDWDYYILLKHQRIYMQEDAEPDTHPIRVRHVGRWPRKFFDMITYQKTGAFLRWINDYYLGPEIFRAGIRRYIKANQFRATDASDLIRAMSEVSELPISDLITNWIDQPGHPVIDVQLLGEGLLHLSQSRHLTNSSSLAMHPEAAKQNWIIPVDITVADYRGNTNIIKLVMDSKETEVVLPDWFDSNCWVKLNAGYKAPYQVKYSRKLLSRLEDPLRSRTLGTSDRINLIHNVFLGANAEFMSIEDLFEVWRWFGDDVEGAIMIALHDTFGWRKLSAPNRRRFKDMTLKRYVRLFEMHGLSHGSNHSPSDAEALGIAYMELVLDGAYMPLIEAALEEFNKHGNKVDLNIRNVVYVSVEKYGSQEQKARLESFSNATKLS